MPINLKAPQLKELKPRIVVCGVGGAGGNAINNMIASGLSGVDFVVANTDAQALGSSRAQRIIQMGLQLTEGLGAGSRPEIGKAAAEEALEEIRDCLAGSNMVFLAAGMGGGTGTGAAPIIAAAAREMGILTVGVVTKPFHFESGRRMRVAEAGIAELREAVDTLIIIPVSPTRGRPSPTLSGWRIRCFARASPALLTLWSRRGSSISTSRTCAQS
jgi:cell division protein FtsZ